MAQAVRWEVDSKGTLSASLRALIPPGQAVQCESDALFSSSTNLQLAGQLRGGLLGSISRALLGSESFYTCECRASGTTLAEAQFAPQEFGDVCLHRLQPGGPALLMISGAFLAADNQVQIDSQMQSNVGNSVLSGTGWFLLRAHVPHQNNAGPGQVGFNAYGRIMVYDLASGDERIVDNGHIVAFSENMRYEVRLAVPGSIFNSVSSGEGLMCRFYGPGKLYVQTHKPRPPPPRHSHHGRPYSHYGLTGTLSGIVGLIIFCVIFFAFILPSILASRSMMRDTWRDMEHNWHVKHWNRPF